MPDGYNPDHFEAFVEIEDRHFWFRARNRTLSAVIGRLVAARARGYRVLEVGCGDGNTLRMLEQTCSGAALVGMDLYAEGLQYARRRTHAPLVRGRMEQPPFAVRFHIVGMFDVLEHLDDDRAALARLRELVEPGGTLVVTVPAHQRLWSRFDEEAHHCRRYEPADLAARLRDAGFEVEYLTLFMMALYPLARIGRKITDLIRSARKRRGRTEGSAIADEIRVRPGVNGLLTIVLSPEVGLLGKRWHLPFGTSILAVARVPR
jgi:SAM-dependent methyltransferase